MDLSEVRKSKLLITAAEDVEELRRALNGAYSEVPSELGEVFHAALDQIADQQFAVSEALTWLIESENVAEAEQMVTAATSEAHRPALRAARSYANLLAEEAESTYKQVVGISANIADLIRQKQILDNDFARAVQLHEQNDINALRPLLVVAGGYKNWCDDARLLVTGSKTITEAERKRIRLQYIAIIVALALGLINISVAITFFFLRH